MGKWSQVVWEIDTYRYMCVVQVMRQYDYIVSNTIFHNSQSLQCYIISVSFSLVWCSIQGHFTHHILQVSVKDVKYWPTCMCSTSGLMVAIIAQRQINIFCVRRPRVELQAPLKLIFSPLRFSQTYTCSLKNNISY